MRKFTPRNILGKVTQEVSQSILRNRMYRIFLPLLALLFGTQVSNGQIAAWDFFGNNTATATFAATTFNANLVSTSGANNVTRGAGAAASAANNSFRTTGFQNNGIATSNTDYFQVTLRAATGFKLSLSTIDARLSGTQTFVGTGGVSNQFAYSTDGTTFTLIGSPAVLTGTVPLTMPQVNVSGISALQNVPAGTTVYLRFYASGQTTTGGWGFFSNTSAGTNGLAIGGTVTAVPSTFTVTYDGNTNTGGTAPVDANSPYTSGSNVTVLSAGTLTKTGYTFNGWNTAANGSGAAYSAGGTISNLSANTTLYAQWQINTYTFTYDGNTNDGGTAPVDGSSPYNFGSNITVLGPGTLTKTGYSFSNWNTAANGSGVAYTPGSTFSGIAANTTLYAQWILNNTYSVTYDGNTNTSGTPPVDGSSPYTAGANVTVLGQGTLAKTGYAFTGWNTAANGSGTPYAAGASIVNISANTVLYAQWQINTYTVTYDGNTNTGGAAPVDGSSPYNYNSNVTVLGVGTLTKTNYNFTGWNTAANGSGTPYAAGATITGIANNVTLYAQWAIITYTVTYNGNTNTGGTAPVDGNSPYAIGTNVTVLTAGTLVKTGYTFTGWNTAADGSGAAYSAGGTISNLSANTTLFAQWQINTYTVTYNGNGNTGGSVPVDPSSPYNFGSTVTVLANTGSLVKTGSTFAGWNTAADGSGTNYAATGAVTFTLGAANVVLYAKWSQPLYEPFNYTVGGTIGGTTTGTASNNWTNHSGTGPISVTSGSLSYTGLSASTGNKVRLPGSNTATSSDVNRAVTLVTGATVGYYSMLINVADNTQLSAGGDYFAGFGATSGTSVTTLFARLFIKSSGTGFQLGITNNSGTGTSTTYYTTDLSFGTTYFVVVKHDFNGTSNDISSLWVNPTSLGGTEPSATVTNSGSSSSVAAFASVFLRNTTTTPKVDIDEVRAGASWSEVTPVATYQLTTTAGTGGSVTAPATSPTTVNHGAATTITATANVGYAFSNWTVESGSASIADANSASTTVTLTTGDASVKANFVATNFTITATAQTTGGTISPSGAVTVSPGANQSFTITKDACNDIADVIVDGVNSVLGDLVGNTYTFTNVNANHTIDVYFNPSTSTTWTGAVNTNWDDAGNWTSCVPNATLDVVIPDGATPYPVLNVDAEVNSITVAGSASLSLNGKTLTINGGYTADPTASLIGSDASNLIINSTNTISSAVALRLNALTVNGGTTTLASAVEISGGAPSVSPGVVTIQTGSQLESNGFLTIKSNQYGTARVAQGDDAGNYITGDVTVERYIPNNGFRSWRFLSVPTFGSQTIRQAWQEGAANPSPLQNNLAGYGTLITGTGTLSAAQSAGFDGTLSNGSFLSWGGSSWSNVASTNSAIATLKGYMLFVRGDRAQVINGAVTSTSSTTLRTKGSLYQGTQSIPSFGANSFNAVGNLYASAIDFTQLQRTGGTQNLFYIWDSKKQSGSSLGAYQTFSATNGFQCTISGGSYTFGQANTKIESGQAFFVSTTTAGTLTLTEASKVGNGGSLGFRPVNPATLSKIDSRLYAAGSNDITDAAVVVFNDKYSNAVGEEDAVKMSNTIENLGVLQAGKTLSVEGRRTITSSDEIVFNMWNLKQQQYTLELVPQNLNTPGLTAVLEDSYLNTKTPVSMNGNTSVRFTVDANPASAAANRFRIVFEKTKAVVAGEPAYTIAPNPVENRNLNIVFKNRAAGGYSIRLVTVGGQSVLTRKVAHAGGTASQNIVLPVKVTSGTYMVEIVSPDKTIATETVIIK